MKKSASKSVSAEYFNQSKKKKVRTVWLLRQMPFHQPAGNASYTAVHRLPALIP